MPVGPAPCFGEIQDRWAVRQASRAFVATRVHGAGRTAGHGALPSHREPSARRSQEIGFAVLGRPPGSRSRGDERVVADVSFNSVCRCFAAAAAAFGTRARRAPDRSHPGGVSSLSPRPAPSRVWAFEGSVPGPTIEAERGRPVRVEWRNELDGALPVLVTVALAETDGDGVAVQCLPGLSGGIADPHAAALTGFTVVHLHGGLTPAAYDGWTENISAPGQHVVSDYPMDPLAALLWYHDCRVIHGRIPTLFGRSRDRRDHARRRDHRGRLRAGGRHAHPWRRARDALLRGRCRLNHRDLAMTTRLTGRNPRCDDEPMRCGTPRRGPRSHRSWSTGGEPAVTASVLADPEADR